MNKALARRLAASAERLQTFAAFLAACEIVSIRRGISSADIRRGLTLAETHKLLPPHDCPKEVARLRAIASARHEALYLSHIVFGREQRPLARVAGISPPALRKALAAVEERRSDPIVDRMLDEAELQLMGEVA